MGWIKFYMRLPFDMRKRVSGSEIEGGQEGKEEANLAESKLHASLHTIQTKN